MVKHRGAKGRPDRHITSIMKGHSYYPIIFALGLASFAQVCICSSAHMEDIDADHPQAETPEVSAQHFGGGIPGGAGALGPGGAQAANGGFLEELLKNLGGGNGQKQAQKETVTKTMKQTITVGAAPTEAAGKNGTNNAAAGGVKTVIQTITSGAAPPTQPAAAATVTVTVTAAADAKTVTQMMTMTQVQTITMVQMIACGTTQGNPVPASQASAIASSAADAASSNLAKKPPPAASTPAASTPAAAPPPPVSSAAPPASSAAPPAASTTSAAQKSSTTPLAAQPAPPTTTAAAPSKPQTTAQPAQAASSLVLPVAGGAAVAAPALSTMDPAGLQGVNNMPINLSGLTLNSNLNLGAIAAQKTPAAVNVGAAAAAAPTTTGTAEPFKLVLSN